MGASLTAVDECPVRAVVRSAAWPLKQWSTEHQLHLSEKAQGWPGGQTGREEGPGPDPAGHEGLRQGPGEQTQQRGRKGQTSFPWGYVSHENK